MSFSADAKAELCSGRIEKRSLAVAECYGILLYCNTFHANEIRIITASPDFSVRLPRLFWKAFSLNFDVLPPEDALGKRSFCITEDRADPGSLRCRNRRTGRAPYQPQCSGRAGLCRSLCPRGLSGRRQRDRPGKALSSGACHQSPERQPRAALPPAGDGSGSARGKPRRPRPAVL